MSVYLEEAHRIHCAIETSTSWRLETIPVGEGQSVELWICEGCGIMEAHCNHEKNSWNTEETKLTCDFCGADGT